MVAHLPLLFALMTVFSSKENIFFLIIYIQRGMRLGNAHPFHFVNCPPYIPMELLALFLILLGLSVPGSESAVHRDVVPIDVLCPLRGQEQHRVGNLLWFA